MLVSSSAAGTDVPSTSLPWSYRRDPAPAVVVYQQIGHEVLIARISFAGMPNRFSCFRDPLGPLLNLDLCRGFVRL
jgi:hypothetical protein